MTNVDVLTSPADGNTTRNRNEGQHRGYPGEATDREYRSRGKHRAQIRFKWTVLSVVLLADVMDLVDSTVANLAGPSIHQDLGGSESALQWVLAAYTFAFAAGLIISGRVGDILGHRQVFLVGMAGFTLASCLCGLSLSIPMLIAARAAQGLFGAIMIPQGCDGEGIFPAR